MSRPDLPAGWTRWHDGPHGVLILTYRPDVFDGERFPPGYLPTLTVKRARTRGPRGRPAELSNADTGWRVELRLEPDVTVESHAVDDREEGVELAIDRAEAFANGEIALEDAYTHPPAEYLDTLASLLDSARGL